MIKSLPSGTSIVYSLVQAIPNLEEPLQSTVRIAFADSLKTFWNVLIGVAALGFISSLLMKGLPLHTSVDRTYGINATKQRGSSIDSEIWKKSFYYDYYVSLRPSHVFFYDVKLKSRFRISKLTYWYAKMDFEMYHASLNLIFDCFPLSICLSPMCCSM